jgi:16S rRNA (uracil1498-N3)-methyltransferase
LTDQFEQYDQVLIAYEESAKAGETAAFVKAQAFFLSPKSVKIVLIIIILGKD